MNKRKILLILGILALLYGFFNVLGAFLLHSLNDITIGNVDDVFVRGLLFCVVGIALIIASRFLKINKKSK